MAVIRQQNWLGQQRADVPHIRALESGVAADFDLLAGVILAGGSPYVVKGFALIPLAVGTAATSLQLQTAGGVMVHPLATDSGSIFSVPSTRALETLNAANSRVTGSFTAGAVNYIGVDLRRSADATTVDLVQFITDSGTTTQEQGKGVSLGRTLDYQIVISTQDFAATPNLAPLAKVTTDASNNISSIQDARWMLYRLGGGGSVPSATASYSWPGGRTEVGDNSDFAAGDKIIGSTRDWMSAMMSRVWELGGGQYWYSPTADRNVRMIRSGTTFTNGEWFEWTGTDLHWQGLRFLFDNSTAYYNDVQNQTTSSAGLTNLADGECVYVDIDRTTNRTGGTALTPKKVALTSLGTPATPGSRYILAYRNGTTIYTRDSSFPVGSTFNVATNTSLGIVQLTYAAGTPATPKVAPQDANGVISNTATAGNNPGFAGTGFGSGAGVQGTGAVASVGVGVGGVGGSGGGAGGFFTGGGSGNGVTATGGSGGGIGITAQGGGGGGGVLGVGGNYGVAGRSTDASATNALLGIDPNGYNRWGLDYQGMPTARISVLQEEWITATGLVTIANPLVPFGGKWGCTISTGTSNISVSDPNTSTFLSARSLNLNANASSTGNLAVFTTGALFTLLNNDYIVAVATWEASLAQSGNNNTLVFVGFSAAQSPASSITAATNKKFGFGQDVGGETTWQTLTNVDGANNVLPTNTGISFTAVTRFRIVLTGGFVNGVGGGNLRCRYYVNDTLVKTDTVSPAALGAMYFVAQISTSTGASNQVLNVGPVTVTWTRLAQTSVPAL